LLASSCYKPRPAGIHERSATPSWPWPRSLLVRQEHGDQLAKRDFDLFRAVWGIQHPFEQPLNRVELGQSRLDGVAQLGGDLGSHGSDVDDPADTLLDGACGFLDALE
jgi:hypothetical protein